MDRLSAAGAAFVRRLQGSRGDQSAESRPAATSSPAAAARNAYVISLRPGVRPSREPSFEYAACSDLALRAAKNWPPVLSAIACSVAGSGGTGTRCGGPPYGFGLVDT